MAQSYNKLDHPWKCSSNILITSCIISTPHPSPLIDSTIAKHSYKQGSTISERRSIKMGFNNVTVEGNTFELTGSAGHGRFGTAFVYRHESGRKLICKLISPTSGTEDITHLIKREISILQTLTHPNIVRYISSDSEPPDGQARIFMEYCEGGDLSRADKALFTPAVMWRVFFQLALSLAYCHHGLNVTRLPNGIQKFEVEARWTPILHRDIKPSNVLLWSSNSDIVKLCDFGIGKVIRSEMSGTYTGTSAFRPPEITREKPHWTTKSDIYSLGCTILYLISRTLPPNNHRQRLTGNALLEAIRNEAPRFEDIFTIIEKCLDTTAGRDGRERPSSLALLEITGHRAAQSAPTNSLCSIQRWETCFEDLIEYVGNYNGRMLGAGHEDELVVRLCFLIRDGGDSRLATMRERLSHTQEGTVMARRLRTAISILDAERKFDEIVLIAEKLSLSPDMPPAQRDGLVHQLLLLMKDGGGQVTKGETQETPLHRSVRRGEAGQISILLRAGANINALMSRGRTALQIAADLGFQQVASILLVNGAEINGQDRKGYTALHLAAQNGHDMIIRTLLNKEADINGRNGEGDTALHLAAQRGHLTVIGTLLEKGAKINEKDAKGQTALHFAAENGHLDAVRLLLKNGANANTENSDGNTAREMAVQRGYSGVVALLDH